MSEPLVRAAAAAAPWEPPALGGPLLPLRRRNGAPADAEREAWERGHAEGREAGLAAAREEARRGAEQLARQAQQLEAILDLLARPLADLDLEVQRQLATLAGSIARAIVRRELRTHPDEIVAVVRETVALLPASARDVRVHLHPEDAAVVRARLPAPAAEHAWSIIEDPVLARGGCRVVSDRSSIDAQLEQRLGAVMATLLGDERAAPEETRAAAVVPPAARAADEADSPAGDEAAA